MSIWHFEVQFSEAYKVDLTQCYTDQILFSVNHNGFNPAWFFKNIFIILNVQNINIIIIVPIMII